MKFRWSKYAANEWFCPVGDVVLRVDDNLNERERSHNMRWVIRIEVPEPLVVVERITSPFPTIEEAAEMAEVTYIGRYGEEGIFIGLAQIQTLIEKKWGISTNSFIPLAYGSLLDAAWSEMYIPKLARCFIVQTLTQWMWITCSDDGNMTSGTATSLRDAKTKAVLAAVGHYIVSSTNVDYDTLEQRREKLAY